MQIPEKDIVSLKEKTVRGLSTLVTREILMKVFAIAGQFVLIRLLLPEYFGIFAIIIFIENTAELFTDVGLTSAIIQKKGIIDNKEVSSIFFLRTGLSFLGFCVLFFSAPFLIAFFPHTDTQNILMLRILAVIMLIKPYRLIITSLLERDLSYNIISFIDLFGIVCYYFVAIGFALLGFRVWSLILAVVIKEVSEVFLAGLLKRWIPFFQFQWQSLIKFAHFGTYLQIGAILNYLNQSIIPALGGKLIDTRSVGYLYFGSNIAMLPNVITDNFGRIAFSGYSKAQHDLQFLSHIVERSINLLNIILFLFIVLIFGFSREIIFYLFAEKWMPAIPAIYWYVVSTYFFGGTVTMGHSLFAIGKSKDVAYMSFVPLAIQWIFPLLFIHVIGFNAIGIGFFAESVILFIGYIYLLRINGININVWKSYTTISLILALALVFSFFLNTIFFGSFSLLVVKIFTTILFYIFLCFMFIKKEVLQLYTLSLEAIKLYKKPV